MATLRGKPRPDLRECENGDGEGELEREMWPDPCGSLLFIAEIRHSDQNQLTDYSPSLRAEQELIAGTQRPELKQRPWRSAACWREEPHG